MALLGYGRVSTDGQSLTAQVTELKAAGCTEIFQEKVSGAKTKLEGFRPRLAARLRHRSPPDSLGIIHCPDEVGPSETVLSLNGECSQICEDV
jgi:Resolvase, N terminal domain